MPVAKPRSAPQPDKPSKAAVKPKSGPATKNTAAHARLEKPGKTAISAKTSLPHVPVSKALQTSAKSDIPLKKVTAVPPKSNQAQLLAAADALLAAPAKKKPGRPPKSPAAADSTTVAAGANRGRKPKSEVKPEGDEDLSDIEAEFAEEPAVVEATTEKVKPLRMKISKAKERALMKEFGLDETVLSEEDILKRRLRLKTLIKLGKTRGYLTHGEISDHLPDKLVDAETLEVVINMLNDMGVAVYEQAPDAETLLLNNTGATVATEEEAEEEAEAALSTVDSEFGRTTDPVRMYMREMGTVELLTREGEIEIAKRIEGGL
ncbi:MAG: RNA polymerase sigma factor region1.1 domain-containing protein, partial [Polaromonas sp.]